MRLINSLAIGSCLSITPSFSIGAEDGGSGGSGGSESTPEPDAAELAQELKDEAQPGEVETQPGDETETETDDADQTDSPAPDAA
jgi:hypothetical protein